MVCFTITFLSLLECIIVDRMWRANAKKVEDEKKNGNMTKRKRKVRKMENNHFLRNIVDNSVSQTDSYHLAGQQSTTSVSQSECPASLCLSVF